MLGVEFWPDYSNNLRKAQHAAVNMSVQLSDLHTTNIQSSLQTQAPVLSEFQAAAILDAWIRTGPAAGGRSETYRKVSSSKRQSAYRARSGRETHTLT